MPVSPYHRSQVEIAYPTRTRGDQIKQTERKTYRLEKMQESKEGKNRNRTDPEGAFVERKRERREREKKRKRKKKRKKEEGRNEAERGNAKGK